MKKHVLFIVLFAAICCSLLAGENNRFDVKVSGRGSKSIVFIPGFACSAEVWNETLAEFEPNYTCYSLTMNGFAGIKPEAAPDIHSWVIAIASYIKDKHLVKPVLIGHSLGGLIAQWLAADFPDLPGGIVIVDALPCFSILSDPSFLSVKSPDCTAFQKNFSAMSDVTFVQIQSRGMASMVSDTSRIKTIVRWSVQSDRNTLALIYCQLLNTDLRDTLSSIKCPALVLLETNFKGLQQPIEEQYKHLKGATLHYAGKGLHFIMYDDKDWYIQELKSFLN